jgi:hypothetical protein
MPIAAELLLVFKMSHDRSENLLDPFREITTVGLLLSLSLQQHTSRMSHKTNITDLTQEKRQTKKKNVTRGEKLDHVCTVRRVETY